MAPGPLRESPPETDQVTGAAPPPVRVAENCSMDEPNVLVVLQPVQLVSMELAPGAMAKVALEGAAVTPAPAQPATASMRGGRRSAASRSGSLPGAWERKRKLPRLRAGRMERAAICLLCARIPLPSSVPKDCIQFIRHWCVQNVPHRRLFPN